MVHSDMDQRPIIVWFRQDLRLTDHPALHFACHTGRPVIPLYIFDPTAKYCPTFGRSSLWWLYHSLLALNQRLQAYGAELLLFQGCPLEVLPRVVERYKATAVCWSRCYEPQALLCEQKLLTLLAHCDCRVFNSALLFEPWQIRSGQGRRQGGRPGQFYKIFTPFWRACTQSWEQIPPALPPPERIPSSMHKPVSADGERVWYQLKEAAAKQPLEKYWQVGEQAAHSALQSFIEIALARYSSARDFPGLSATSRLSPHLHFGEISPRYIVDILKKHQPQLDYEPFIRQLGWREFSYYQLYHFPQLPKEPWRPEFAHFPWSYDEELLERWKEGLTGYPLVDAGMRQLRSVGWMHNRTRMLVASFLVKDLMLPWQCGADWFWENLVDADLACNSANWQWVAGCGFDAAPFFRIFNPILQGEKFDAEGLYVKRWLPELAQVPKAFVHKPWELGLQAPSNYPSPIIEHKQHSQRALAAFKQLKLLEFRE